MVAAAQNLGYRQSPVLHGAGVLRVFQPVLRKALLHERRGVDDPVYIPRHAVGNDHRGQFAARENVIADADLLVDKQIDGALVDAFIMPAQQNEVFVPQKFKHLLLAERFALGRHIDAPRLMFGVERLDGGTDGLSRHHHARAAAEGIIVAL